MDIDRIRQALVEGDVILDRGQFRINKPTDRSNAVMLRQDAQQNDVGGERDVPAQVRLKPTTWGNLGSIKHS